MDTVISQFPSNFNAIAEAYFEDPNIQSQFKKDMDRNLKIASGIDPDISNEEIADQLNLDNDDIINRGTEDAMLKNDDPTALNLMARNMEVLGAMNKSNPEISPVQLFTQKDLADRYDFSDIYKISFTNSETDPALYETKANLAVEQIYEAMNNLKPNYMRYAFRFIGQPAASIGLSTVGKGWGKVALGATADTVGPAWDMAALGDTIYNTQERYNQELYAMIDDDSMTLEQFNENMKKFIEKIVTEVPSEYQHEIFDSFIEGPNPFADAGASFTNAGIHGFTRVMGKVIPAKALARSAFQIGKLLTGRAKNTGAANFNRNLMNQISKTMSNKVDDVAVDEAAKAKTASTMPEGTTPDDIELANSINKNKEVDKNLVKNSNEDRFWSGLKVSQEDIDTHNTPTSEANRANEDVTTLNMIVPGYAKENMIIRHGKGVNNDVPFSSIYEAEEALKKLQGRVDPIYPWQSDVSYVFNPDIEPEYIAIQSASRTPWSKDPSKPGSWDYSGTTKTNTGDQDFFGGGYGSVYDSPWRASEGYYLTQHDRSGFFEAKEITNKFYKSFLNDENKKEAIEFFDKDGSLKEKVLKRNALIADNEEAINKKYEEALANRYALVKFLRDMHAKEETISRVVEASKKYDADYLVDDANALPEYIDILQKVSREGVESVEDVSKDLLKRLFEINSLYKQNQLYLKQGQEKAAEYTESALKNNFTFLYQAITNFEFNKYLSNMAKDVNFTTKSNYLNTLGSVNPMKNPEGVLYFDRKRGLIPFADLFYRGNNKENSKILDHIIWKDNEKIDSIEKDMINAFEERWDTLDNGYANVVSKSDDDGYDAIWTKGEYSKKEASDLFAKYLKSNRKNIWQWRQAMRDILWPHQPSEDIRKFDYDYDAWERDYLKSKGIKQVWHNGGRSLSFNLSIQNFDTLTPVALEETNVGRPWYTQKGFNNAHMIVRSEDGTGYWIEELHGVEGAKPRIVKGFKVIDKGDYE